MSHFGKSNFPRPESSYAPQEIYDGAHRYFSLGYTDVVLRNDATDELFLAVRAREPEKDNVWFMGGRTDAGETIEQSAARHTTGSTGLTIAPGRFIARSNLDIAHAQSEEQGGHGARDAKNTVLVASLNPEEVEALNRTVAERRLGEELVPGSGTWYAPEPAIWKGFRGPVRQFLRDYLDSIFDENARIDRAKAEDARYRS